MNHYKNLKKPKKISWLEHWQSEDYMSSREVNYNVIKDYIQIHPKNILDIGCGLAIESEFFQKEFNSELFLIDGDSTTTKGKPRYNKYGPLEDFQFYNKIEDLKEHYNDRGLRYKFYDFNNLDKDYDFGLKFDLIYSNLSCGFHYPATTYKTLIENNSDENTILIMDFQKNSLDQQTQDIDILNTISESNTTIKLHIRFK